MKMYYNLKSILGLSLSLAKAQFKLRNEGSYLGIFWYLLEPLALFVIFLSIKAVIANSEITFYPLYLLLGLIMFNFFSKVTNKATKIIANNVGFIKSIKISYESLVIAEALEAIFSHFFEIVLFILLMVFFKIPLAGIIFYPLILFFLFLFVLGLSFILTTLGTYINDLDNVWRVATQILFFTTPLFYVMTKNSPIYNFNIFNPIFYFINISRDIIIYNSIPEIWMIGTAMGFSFVFFTLGIIIFRRYKYKFAEMI
ncbi:MAG: ABC transporter permease [Patescibacteria group bacterium]